MYEVLNEGFVLLELCIRLVWQIGHDDRDVAVRLLHGVVDIAHELVHVQSLVRPILHERQVDFLNDIGEVIQPLLHLIFFLIHKIRFKFVFKKQKMIYNFNR